MKRFLILLALAGCATPPSADKGMQITIAPERLAQCKEAGGCALLSQAEVAAVMEEAYQMGAQAAAQEMAAGLDSHGCRRGST